MLFSVERFFCEGRDHAMIQTPYFVICELKSKVIPLENSLRDCIFDLDQKGLEEEEITGLNLPSCS